MQTKSIWWALVPLFIIGALGAGSVNGPKSPRRAQTPGCAFAAGCTVSPDSPAANRD